MLVLIFNVTPRAATIQMILNNLTLEIGVELLLLVIKEQVVELLLRHLVLRHLVGGWWPLARATHATADWILVRLGWEMLGVHLVEVVLLPLLVGCELLECQGD